MVDVVGSTSEQVTLRVTNMLFICNFNLTDHLPAAVYVAYTVDFVVYCFKICVLLEKMLMNSMIAHHKDFCWYSQYNTGHQACIGTLLAPTY